MENNDALDKELFTPLKDNKNESSINTQEASQEIQSYWKSVGTQLMKNKVSFVAIIILVLLIFCSIFLPQLTSYHYTEQNTDMINLKPNSTYWFGTDSLGRDLFTRVWVATRSSLIIGIVGACIVVFIGTIYGSISAYYGAWVDIIMMRIIEIVGSVPYLVLVILLSLFFGKGIGSIILAMSLTGWIGTARMIRGQVMQLRNEDFVLASYVLGASTHHTIVKHIVPNIAGYLIIALTFAIPGFIMGETLLSFLGIGIQTPNTSLGLEIKAGFSNLRFFPYQTLIPSAILAVLILSFNLFGDALRDAMDPKLRR